jgi:hypothetical protein
LAIFETITIPVFSSLLFIICFFILIPFTIGILISLVLRELYKRQLWEKSIADEKNNKEVTETLQENVVVKLYDPSLDEINDEVNNGEINSEKTSDTGMNVGQVPNDATITTEPVTAEPIAVESISAESILAESSLAETVVAASDSELNTEPFIPSAISETSIDSKTSETPVISEKNSETISETNSGTEQPLTPEEIQPEKKPSSVFDGQKVLLPDTFKVDDILDEMVNDNPPIIPADIALRLEADGTSESRISQMQHENQQDVLEPHENEILTKITAANNADDQSLSQPEMMFHDFNHDTENTNTVHSEISPLAIEVLGEDFNFNSFFNEKLKSKQENSNQENKEPITVCEIGQGIYQSDGGFLTVTNDRILHDLLPKEQEIVSLYPDHLIQNALIEPDFSATARNFSFTEESQPMLIRKKNKK